MDQYIYDTFTLTKQSFAEQGGNINQKKKVHFEGNVLHVETPTRQISFL